ncbi:hypothetical protein B0H13DRAFT_2352707 [Mycena leptocephala]|nr:hypothetical protein B0H13DRAFT_2352707 [Mycena leptocephala]
MPKVEDLSVWLRWAVDPASALRVLLLRLLLALPTHFLLPLVRPYLLPLLKGRLSSAVCWVVLLPSTRAEPYSVPDAGEEVRDTEGVEGGEVWGAGVCGGGESFVLRFVLADGGCAVCSTTGRPYPLPLLSFPLLPCYLLHSSPSFLVPRLSLIPLYSFSICFSSPSRPPVLLPSFLLFPPSFFLPHTRSTNFRYIFGVLTPSLNPQCTLSTTPTSSALKPRTLHFWFDTLVSEVFCFSSCIHVRGVIFWGEQGEGVWIAHRRRSMLTRGSLLQRHVLFRIQHRFLFCSPELPFPVRMHVCASTGGSLAGDAGSGGRHSLTCQVAASRFVPRPSVWPIRSARSPCACFPAFGHALGSCGAPRPGTNADAYQKRASLGAIPGHAELGTLNQMRGIECARFTSPGHVYAQQSADRYRYWYRYLFVRCLSSNSRVGIGF